MIKTGAEHIRQRYGKQKLVLAAHSWGTVVGMKAAINGILLGALCYATFDLTSQAVFKVWATHISVLDILWGAFATGAASAVATYAALRFAPSVG